MQQWRYLAAIVHHLGLTLETFLVLVSSRRRSHLNFRVNGRGRRGGEWKTGRSR
jgi:hypothetical protein